MGISIASAMTETRWVKTSAEWVRALQQGRAACPLIAVAILAVYWPALDHPFQYDDIHSIVDNPHLRTLAHIDDFFWRSDMFSADTKGGMYRPLVLVSYAINYAADGYRVVGYRLFNIALHLTNALLLWGLVHRLTASAAAALAGGLLFALHPVAGEPVNYISSRSESLCALFILASLACHIRYRQGGGVGVSWRVVAAFAGALLAKSVGIVMPLALLVYDLASRSRPWRWRDQAGYYLPYVLVSGAYVIWVRQALQTALVDHPVRSLSIQVATQCKALVYYLKLLAVPWGQSVEHPFALAQSWDDAAVWSAALLVGSLVYGLWRVGKTYPEVAFWIIWPALFLLPTMIVPLNVLVNEHRLYIPAMGWAVAMVGSLLWTLQKQAGPILGVLIVLMGALAVQRSQVWRSPTALWTDAQAKGPLMPRPHLYLGDEYKVAGHNEEALKSYERALTINPSLLSGGDRLVIHNNTGAAYLALGRNEEAEAAYRRALAIDPDYSPAREALEALVAIRASAWHPIAETRYQHGMRLLVAGQLEEAIAQLRSGLQAQRHPKLYHSLAIAYERAGDYVAAIDHYRTILEMPNASAGLVAGARQRLTVLAVGDNGGD